MKTLALVIALVATPAVGMAQDAAVQSCPQGCSCSMDGKPLSCTIGVGALAMTPPHTSTLYTETYGGRIGIVHGLTKDECEVQRKQALGIPATEEEIAAKKVFDDALSTAASAGPAYVTATPAYTHTASDVLYAKCRDKPLTLPPAPPHAP